MGATGIDEAKLEAFMGQAVTDMGAIISAPLMVIGEKLGLYKAMAHAGPLTSEEVAERSGAAERYVREWLGNQAAGGYVTYDHESDRYTLPDEQALADRQLARKGFGGQHRFDHHHLAVGRVIGIREGAAGD